MELPHELQNEKELQPLNFCEIRQFHRFAPAPAQEGLYVLEHR
ncbi:hypothetical protein LEP1GSC058_1857 [Leptospira fainei serovar Hurstbridge str. BUT 6]|uniref:Uncharacterized protein n=1 Tax=Leptospira fainei serovar Hurstbridge str. BUT 6 TaxID=1193011 RepID=S3V2F6_9LEPT|nr:hypothetical protein LEP1GSC058_1857 [Leptospira fainei serovar Hurstbridge str. BUT 6]